VPVQLAPFVPIPFVPIHFDPEMLQPVQAGNFPGPLSLDAAPHLGELELNIRDLNTISGTRFEDGDEVVRITQNGHPSYFKPAGIQMWFNAGHNINPNNNQVVTQDQIARFTYRRVYPQT
jgi:hypothetical protein